MYYSVSDAGLLLGVCRTTIRRWDKKALIKCIRTPGGHRRIHISEIQRIIEGKKRRYSKKKRGVVTYARVSSHDHNASKNLRDYPIFENVKKLTGKWVVPLNAVVASELFLNKNNVSRLKTCIQY